MSAKKVGGIWFFRAGRLRFSFCVAGRATRVPLAQFAQHAVAAAILGGAIGWWI
jgi:hypothetical protein